MLLVCVEYSCHLSRLQATLAAGQIGNNVFAVAGGQNNAVLLFAVGSSATPVGHTNLHASAVRVVGATPTLVSHHC
jgi:hypothetical protein